MKNIIINTCILIMFCNVKAQIVVNLPTLNLSLEDRLSRSFYNNINTSNTTLATQELVNKGAIALLTPIFNNQLKELTTYNPLFDTRKIALKTFVSSGVFSKSGGHNSYGYIKKKYPIINPLNPTDAFQNTVIQLRFSKKLNAEKNKIAGYLNKNNPIPEGERVLLVLTALENVINLTLENEKY